MTTPNAKPRAGEHTDRFGLPEANYQDAMEMGNSLARAIVADPDAFQFDERGLCRAFCLSAKEEILATQRWDTAAAERDALAAQNRELVEFAKMVRDWYENAGNADPDRESPGSRVLWSMARALLAKVRQ